MDASARTRLKPLGQLVPVGVSGYRLHARQVGQGTPTVVMYTGLGMPGLLWGAVLREVGQFTNAVSVDRAGYGWSDQAPPDQPRTSENMVAEIRTLVQGLGLRPPYILVGHSFGGINMLLYTQRHRADVADIIPSKLPTCPG